MAGRKLTMTHWGAYEVESDGTEITAVHPFAKDPDPSPIGASLTGVTRARVMRPSIRKSWLERGPAAGGKHRGAEPFVEVDWDTAADLLARELDRIRTDYGNEAIYGGSYGWASAGRFHHAQSQLHRFLSVIGGYTSSKNTYSHAATEVIVPHVVGASYAAVQDEHTSWPVIAEHTDLFVAFGGVPHKNSQVQSSGHGRHTLRGWLETARDRGTRFVNVSPLRDDILEEVGAEWIPIRPGTDVAMMLALAHRLVVTDRHDAAFLTSHCVGWERLEAYLLGETDGVAKSSTWAQEITEVPAGVIDELADRMAAGRTMVNASWSIQRADHGEQAHWMTMALAAVVGQIGLPGGGFGLGYGAIGSIGNGVRRIPFPRLGRPANRVDAFIPVARIADLLLHPGEEFTYDGGTYRYPHVRLVYWCGGNPFHHHQDLNRLVRAWQRPETVVVNEPFWTATARHADIVLPSTTPMERYDLGGAPADDFLVWMPRLIDPVGEARDDYAIFGDLARRLGAEEEFSEGRTADEWIEHLYAGFRAENPEMPPLEELQERGFHQHADDPEAPSHEILLQAFRMDPETCPIGTPSGRIELYSETIAGFGLADCPPHPTWMEPYEWLGAAGRYPLHLISNQPATRLHGQLDHGETSAAAKLDGREVIRLHPDDADDRGLTSGDTVRIFNDRGEILAGLLIDDAARPGVAILPTGAWYTPEHPGIPGSRGLHGNPNVLTRDAGTSGLAQGPTAQTCLVEVARADGEAPLEDPHAPPPIQEG